MVNFHFGPTLHPGWMRFHYGTISRTVDGTYHSQECYFQRPIERWYGVSWHWGRARFFGLIVMGPQEDVREKGKAQ